MITRIQRCTLTTGYDEIDVMVSVGEIQRRRTEVVCCIISLVNLLHQLPVHIVKHPYVRHTLIVGHKTRTGSKFPILTLNEVATEREGIGDGTNRILHLIMITTTAQ